MIQRRNDFLVPLLTVTADVAAIEAAFLVSYWLRFYSPLTSVFEATYGIPPLEGYVYSSLVFIPMWLFVFRSRGMYGAQRNTHLSDEFFSIVRLVTIGLMIVMSATFFYRGFSHSRGVFILLWGTSIVTITLGRFLVMEFEKVLCRSGKALKTLKAQTLRGFERRYDDLLAMAFRSNPRQRGSPHRRGRKKQSKARNLLERLRDYRVPFTNNQVERDIRMMKVKQKISGTFRNRHGADVFCRVRGYLSTARKNGLSAFNALLRALGSFQRLFSSIPRIAFFAAHLPRPRAIACLFFLTSVHNSVDVLAQQLSFQKFYTDHGLSSNSIYTVFQDRQGFLWLGTDNGLNRFDGYSFISYKHITSDSLSLSENNVNLITQDSTGRLWCVNRQGIDGFNSRMEKVVHFPGIKRCYTDTHGTVWMVSRGEVSYYEPKAGRRTILQIKPNADRPPAKDFSAGAIFVDRKERIWVGTDTGVIRIDRPANVAWYYKIPQSHQLTGQYPHRVTNIVENDSGSLWLATGQDGLVLFDPTRERYESVDLLPHASQSTRSALSSGQTDVNYLPSSKLKDKDFAFTVLADKDGMLWIGTAADLFRYDPLLKRPTRYAREDARPGALSSSYVWSLYQDRSGVLWIGTWEGLNKTMPTGIHFYSHEDFSPAAQFLGKTTIRAICQTREGKLWVSTMAGELSRIDPRTNTVARYSYAPGSHSPFAGRGVHTIVEDTHGLIWFGSDFGLSRYDPRSGSIKNFDHQEGDNRSINSNSIASIFEDGNGRLWISTAEGMNLFNRKTESFQRFDYSNAGGGSIVEIEGTLWMSTWDGLAELHPETNTWNWYRHTDDPSSLPANHLTSICKGKDHSIWLASFGGGCLRYDIHRNSFTAFTRAEGLPSDYLFSVMNDDSGRIWMTTKNGLCMLNPRTNNIRLFTTNEGLLDNRFSWGGILFKSSSGLLFVGGGYGFNYFNPTDAGESSKVPPIVISSFMVNGTEMIEEQVERRGGDISLSYKENTFDVSFAALDFVNPVNNKFIYKLEGYDREWTRPGTRREERYVNVPPGSYVLRVKGSNSDGMWNEDGEALEIVITPPWWATWWFKVLVALAIISIFWAAHSYRMKTVLGMQKVRYRIAADLHDEIGSNLSSIAVASQTIKRQENISDTQSEQLGSIAETAKMTAETMRDIVWFINPQNESTEDLLLKMKDNAASLLRGIDFSFTMPKEGAELRLSPSQKRNFYLIYKEALHNAVKHASATRLEIEIGISRKEVFLRIVDDGVGFDHKNPSKGQGLNSLRRRAEEVGGELTITTVPDKGTAILLRIPA